MTDWASERMRRTSIKASRVRRLFFASFDAADRQEDRAFAQAKSFLQRGGPGILDGTKAIAINAIGDQRRRPPVTRLDFVAPHFAHDK